MKNSKMWVALGRVFGSLAWRTLTVASMATMGAALPGCPGMSDDPCAVDGVCDDGDFCTTDSCTAEADTNGIMQAVCAYDPVDCDMQVCSPADGTCVECIADTDCDDGAFCNGVETCAANNTCVAGSEPCGPGTALCDEDFDACVDPCVNDTDCPDDGNFCTGSAICDTNGFCSFSGDPCAATPDTPECDEANDSCVAVGGMVFTLTENADAFVGGDANDVFNGEPGTLNGQGGTVDALDGGGGNDTLNATVVGATTGFLPTIVAIETWNLISAGADNFFDLSTTDGAEKINVTGAADLTFEQLTAGNCAFTLHDSDSNLAFEFDSLDGANTFELTLNGVDDSTVTLDSNDATGTQDLETLNLISAGASTNAFVIANGGTEFDALIETVVTGSADLNFGADQAVLDGRSIDDTGFDGALSLTVSGDLDAEFDMSNLGTPGFLNITPDAQPNALTISGVPDDLTVTFNPTGPAMAHAHMLVLTGDFSGPSTTLRVRLLGTGLGLTMGPSAVGVENFHIHSGGSSANVVTTILLENDPFTFRQVFVTGDQDLNLGGTNANRVDAGGFLGALTASCSGNAGCEIIGGTADDWLRGGNGDDVISAGDGDDYVVGTDGNDTTTGGAGRDLIEVGDDTGTTFDSITDFDPADDTMDFYLTGMNPFVTDIINGSGTTAVATGDSADVATVASGGALVAGATDNVFKLTDTTGINDYSDIDRTGPLITLGANTANGDGIVFMFYDADDGELVIGVLVDTGSGADAQFNGSGDTFTPIVRAAMTPAEYMAIASANFTF